MSAEKDLLKAGIAEAADLLASRTLPGGPTTSRLVALALQWAQGAIDAHGSAEEAEEAMLIALEGYAQQRAAEKFG